MKEEYKKYLAELNEWIPWSFKQGSAYTHLMTKYPELTEEQAKELVNHYLASSPRLLEEGAWNGH